MPTDTSKLVRYSPRTYPALPDGEAEYLTNELRKIASAITSIEQVMVKIDNRLIIHGW